MILPSVNINLRDEAVDQDLPYASADEGFFGTVISHLLELALAIGALLVFFFLIWGAFDWITSGGDSSKTEKARNKMTQAIIGLVLLSATVAIFMLIQNLLGFCVLKFGATTGVCA